MIYYGLLWAHLLFEFRPIWAVIKLILLCAIVFVVIRMLLIFPSVAVDEPDKTRIETSWERTEGQFWILTFAVIGALTPLALLQLAALVGLFAGWFQGGGVFSPMALASDAVQAVLGLLAVAIAAAIASRLYQWRITQEDRNLEPAQVP
jgi:hypothetical protein